MDKPGGRSGWGGVWAAVVIGMLVFGLRLPIWGLAGGGTDGDRGVWGTYIYDDVPIAREDPRLGVPSMWGTIWTRDYNFDVRVDDGSVDNLYRPLVSMSFALQVFVHGHVPGLMHFVNLLIYGLCCGLVARLGQLVGGDRVGWLAGIWFAVHPIHSEAVCAIVGRAELMATAGLVGALVLFLGGELRAGRVLGVTGCGILALLSKEQGMLLPGLLLLAEPVRRMRGGKYDNGWKGLVAGVCFVVGGYIVLREQVLGLKFWWDRSFLDPAVQPMVWSTGWDRWLMPVALLGRATGQLLVPWDLSLDYSGRAIGWTVPLADWRLWLGFVTLLAGVVGMSWAVWRRRWGVVLGLGGLGLMWGVVGNAVSLIGVNYAERLLFLPSVFAALLVGIGMQRWKWGVCVVGVWCVGMAVWAAAYATRWGDREGFYAYSVTRQPNSIRLHQLLADELTKRGAYDEAAEVAARGCAVLPEYYAIWTQAGLIAEKRGRPEEAEKFYERAVQADVRMGSGAMTDFRSRREAAGNAKLHEDNLGKP